MNRPEKVSTALKLLYAALVLAVISVVLNIPIQMTAYIQEGVTQAFMSFLLAFTIIMSALSLGFFALLIYKIGKGKNWARITFLVLSAIGIPISVISLILSLAINPIQGTLSIIEIILEVTAIVLLFQKKSSSWFNSMKKE